MISRPAAPTKPPGTSPATATCGFMPARSSSLPSRAGPYAQLGVKASLELLLLALCTEFSPTLLNTMPEDEQRRLPSAACWPTSPTTTPKN